MAQADSNKEKNGGRKSRRTVLLRNSLTRVGSLYSLVMKHTDKNEVKHEKKIKPCLWAGEGQYQPNQIGQAGQIQDGADPESGRHFVQI